MNRNGKPLPPRGYTEGNLAQVGVSILNASGRRLRCRKCGHTWAVFVGEGGTLPGRWWVCEKSCNAVTPEADSDAPERMTFGGACAAPERASAASQADLDAFNVELLPGVGMRLKCICCGSVWLSFRWSGSSMLPPGYWRCPRGCNEYGRARKPELVTDSDLLHAVALREDLERTERAKVAP